VTLFLTSSYGTQVLSWLTAISKTVASCLPRTQLTSKGPRIGVIVGNRAACLAVESLRLRALAKDGRYSLPRSRLRQAAEARVLTFLVLHTLVRWRNRGRLLIAAPLVVTDDDVHELEWEDSTPENTSETNEADTQLPSPSKTPTKQKSTQEVVSLPNERDPIEAHRLAVKDMLKAAPGAPPKYDPVYWKQPRIKEGTTQAASTPTSIRTEGRRSCPSCKRSIGLDVSSRSFYCLNCDLTFARG
jgi:hypothetical protein